MLPRFILLRQTLSDYDHEKGFYPAYKEVKDFSEVLFCLEGRALALGCIL